MFSCVQPIATPRTSPPGSSVQGISQARMSCHFLCQGIFPTQGSHPHLLHLLHWQVDSLLLAPPGKPHRDSQKSSQVIRLYRLRLTLAYLTQSPFSGAGHTTRSRHSPWAARWAKLPQLWPQRHCRGATEDTDRHCRLQGYDVIIHGTKGIWWICQITHAVSP